MAFYDPYQGVPRQYVAQSFYPAYFSQGKSGEPLMGQDNNLVPAPTETSFPQRRVQGGAPFQHKFLNPGGEGVVYPPSDFGNSSGGFVNENKPYADLRMSQRYSQPNFSPISHGASPSLPLPPMSSGPPLSQPDLFNRVGSTTVSSPVAPSRSVYLGNMPSDIQPNELLDYVRSGIIESVKILPAKNCAFISFVDRQSALLFHSDCILKKLNIRGHDIRIGWGKDTPISPAVMEAIQRDGATRNVYLGNIGNSLELMKEEDLREDLATYGVIDCIKIIPEKSIAFVHFLSILSAIRCVANLPLREKYLDKKCFYGKDRCAFITKTQQHNAAQYLGLAPGMEHFVTAADREFISSALVQQSAAAAQIATQAGGANNLGNRTVYLGNLHQDSSVEEICNVVRGGLLQSIRCLKERHVCFVTFIDPIAAAQFFAMCQLHGLTIHNRRIKVGWGKHSGPLSNALSLAVSNGASRNIYVGNITDFLKYNAKKLREDFSNFGDIEQINSLENKNCAFINFVNIANAIKAIDGIKSFDDYKNFKINFGKDRCGNLPRQFQNQNIPSSMGTLSFESNSNQSLSSNEFINEEL